VLWHAYRGAEERALVELAERYEAERGVHVELLAVPFDAYSAKLSAAVPRAHGPDLFVDAHERLGIYRQEGVVGPAGDAFPDEDVAAFDAQAAGAVTLDGTRWGVPLAMKCVALYVNDALVARPPATLEDLAGLRPSLPADAYPLAYEAENPYYHAAILSGFGGRLLGDDGGYGFVGAGAERSIVLVKDLTADHVVPAEPSGALVKQLFAGGHAAAAIDGPWLADELRDAAGPHSSRVSFHVEPLPAIRETGLAMRSPLTVEAVLLSPSGAQRP
jgi:arabinogalactan oligomer/maltooligosaccharide transport system permease protein